MTHYVDYSKKLLNRLDLAVLRAMKEYEEICQRASEVAGAASSMSQAMPAMYSMSTGLGYSMTLTAGKAYADAVRLNFERLLRVEYYTEPEGDYNAVMPDKLSQVIIDLRSELHGNAKKQAVTGWQFAQRPTVSDYGLERVLDLTPNVPNSAVPALTINNWVIGLQSTNFNVGKKHLYDYTYMSKVVEDLPDAVDSEVHLGSPLGLNRYALPDEYKAYAGTVLKILATKVPRQQGEAITDKYKVSVTAKLPDGTILLRDVTISVGSDHTLNNQYSNYGFNTYNHNVGQLAQDVWKKLQAEYCQDTENMSLWHPKAVSLIGCDIVMLDFNTRVFDARTGTVFFGATSTWPELFTHIAMREIQKGFKISPMRQYGQELTAEERLKLYQQFTDSYAKDEWLENGYGLQKRWAEDLNVPNKWSVSNGEREPTDIEKAEGTYVLINVPGNGYGSNAIAQIKFYPLTVKLTIEPLFDTVLSPRSEYYLLTQALASRNDEINRRQKQAEAQVKKAETN